MITTKTLLPIFTGFYNSIFKYNNEEDDIDWYNEENKTDYKFDDFTFNYKEYENKIAESITDKVEEAICDYFGVIEDIQIKYIEIDYPRYYNYRSDYIMVEISLTDSILAKVKKELIENGDKFAQYLEDNYKSHDGFVSFYEYDVDSWLNEYLNKDNKNFSHCISTVFNFLLLNDDYSEWSIYDEIDGEIYIEMELTNKN